MFLVQNKYAKVWKIFGSKDKYSDLTVGTSEKKSDNSGYNNSTWRARAVGQAFEQMKAGRIKEGNSYSLRGKVENIPYKDKDGKWKESCRLVITAFGQVGAEPATKNDNKSGNNAAVQATAQQNKPQVETDPW